MNIFAEIPASIAGTKRYPSFLNNKKGKVFLYLMLLTLVYFICAYIVPFVSFELSTGGIKQVILENVPDFSLENGTFHIDTPINYEESGTLVVVDTSASNWTAAYDTSDWEDALSDYSRALIADQCNMIFKDEGQVQVFSFADLGIEHFTRDTLISFLPFVGLILIVAFIFLYFWHLLLYLLGALIVALIGMIICSCMHYKLTYGQLILLSIYAKTLSLLVKAVLNLFDVSIVFYGFMGCAVSCIYLGFAIAHIKQNEIERQAPQQPIVF